MSRAVRAVALSALIVLTITACATSKPDRHARRVTISASEPIDTPTDMAAATAAAYEAQRETAAYAALVELNRQADVLAAAAQAADRAIEEAKGIGAPADVPDWSGTSHVADQDATMVCIRAHESDTAGGYSAINPSSGASGAYQALDSTWDGYAGYPRAVDAPPEIQDAWAREALAAAGTQPWAGSGC
jgi:hypothetical protein